MTTPSSLSSTHHVLDGHGGDTTQCSFGDWIRQHALPSASAASKQLAKQSWLPLIHTAGHLREIGRILEAVIYAVLVEIGYLDVLLPRLLLQVLTKLHALLWTQPREGFLSPLLVHPRRKLGRHLLVGVQCFLIRDAVPGGALVISSCEVFVLLPLFAAAQ